MTGSANSHEDVHTTNARTINQIYDALNNITLCKYDDAPAFLRDSPYIIHGYRPVLSVKQCLKSAFLLTNETVNIWSHIIGFLLCFLLMVHRLLSVPDVPLTDNLILTFGLFCFQTCMLLSACYHTFKCHSLEYYKRWLYIDFFGIFFGFVGCVLPGIHLGFYCFENWYTIYMSIVISCFIYVMAWLIYTFDFYNLFCSSLRPHRLKRIENGGTLDLNGSFNGKESKSEPIATCVACPLIAYIGLVMATLLPVVHWVYLCGGINSASEIFLPKLLQLYLILFAAFIFYITKFPECYLPGQFDIIGASHQLWHILVVIAFLWSHHLGSQFVVYIHRTNCFSNVTTLANFECDHCVVDGKD